MSPTGTDSLEKSEPTKVTETPDEVEETKVSEKKKKRKLTQNDINKVINQASKFEDNTATFVTIEIKTGFFKTKNVTLLVFKDVNGNVVVTKVKDTLGEGSFGKVVRLKAKTDITQPTLLAFKTSTDKKSLKNEVNLLHLLHQGAGDKAVSGIQDPPHSVVKVGGDGSLEVGYGYMGTLYDGDLGKLGKDLTLDEIISVIDQLVEGVKHLNDNKIAHLDMKIQNILLRREGGKIIAVHADFGGAAQLSDDNKANTNDLDKTEAYFDNILLPDSLLDSHLRYIHGALLAKSLVGALCNKNVKSIKSDDKQAWATLRGKGLSDEVIQLMMDGFNWTDHFKKDKPEPGEEFLEKIQGVLKEIEKKSQANLAKFHPKDDKKHLTC